MKTYGWKELKRINRKVQLEKIKEEFCRSLPLIIMTLIILAAWIWDCKR